MMQMHGVSQRQACKAVHLSTSTKRYHKRPTKDEPVITTLQDLVARHPAIGFWQCYYRIRRRGIDWNHKRVYRVYTLMKLNIRRRTRRRLPARVKQALFRPTAMNEVWSVDFMADSLWSGRKFRLLNIVDDYNREVIHIEADTSLPTLRLIRCLEMLKQSRGLPRMIRVDNGPEFISSQLDIWCKEQKITLMFIQPGKPMQNGYVERCNGNIRRELLDAYLFQTLNEVRDKAEEWKMDYNTERPHAALGYVPPAEYNLS